MPRYYLFLDGVHLTEAGQQIEADYFYTCWSRRPRYRISRKRDPDHLPDYHRIQQQIDLTQRLRQPGWNVWVNGELWYLTLDSSSAGFPSDPGFPLSGSMGIDYKWQNGWLTGAAITRATSIQPSRSGGYHQDTVALSSAGIATPIGGATSSHRRLARLRHQPAGSDRHHRSAEQRIDKRR